MTVEEAKRAKTDLGENIKNLISQFETQTGMVVWCVSIDRRDYADGSPDGVPKSLLNSVTVAVRL